MAQLNQLDYAGDLSPQETWTRLQNDPHAVLIDVRTPEEWAYVGIVDTTLIQRDAAYVPWLFYPRMDLNPNFIPHVLDAAKPADKDTPLLLICRSGQRSAYGAHALTRHGYRHCYNVASGFEGDLDGNKHRGAKNGWKADGLPWIQG